MPSSSAIRVRSRPSCPSSMSWSWMSAMSRQYVTPSMPCAHGWEIRLVSRTNTSEPWWSIWQAMQRRVADLPPPVEALTGTCGESASRSTETIRPADPSPMMGADSGALATSSRTWGG